MGTYFPPFFNARCMVFMAARHQYRGIVRNVSRANGALKRGGASALTQRYLTRHHPLDGPLGTCVHPLPEYYLARHHPFCFRASVWHI